MRDLHNYQPDESEKLLLKMMEMAVRIDLYPTLKIFHPPTYETLDISYPFELLDKELPLFMPKETLDKENTICMMVKAKLKTGQPCRFLFHLLFMGDAKFEAGVAMVPDNARPLNIPAKLN